MMVTLLALYEKGDYIKRINRMIKNQRLYYDDFIVERFLSLILPLGENIKEVYLFGSRCRDDWRPDSDYDILIVVDRKDREFISKLYDAVMDILLDTGRLISLKIFIASEFNRLKSIPTPFMHSVIKEGIKLGPRH
ncbi:MAG: nucleotidyltransferase domain-containing protein [Thermodesulfobacteriota bacterium]|nr:nucleotidyltransferase domain-containing protein [Thermodesulfobacteriota bacterium]